VKSPAIAERRGTDEVIETRYKQAEQPLWRRAASAENVGGVGTLLGAAELAMHGMPAVAAVVIATGFGATSWFQAKIEKHRKG
jgi:hypothetical protein